MVDFVDRPLATFAVGDASYCWNWKYRWVPEPKGPWTIDDARAGRVVVPPGWEQEIHSINAFAYTKLPWSYLDAPIFEAPHWLLSAGYARPTVRQPDDPVQRAFRTAGLVRGPHSYALVVDDIQKDAGTHRYDWILILEPDISIVRTERHGGQLDVLLRGESSPALLLVRVLHRTTSGDKDAKPLVDELPNATNPTKYKPVRRLLVPAEAVAPDFKVLLYPHRPGDPLPETTWNDDRSVVKAAWSDQTDHIRFTAGSLGKTDVVIVRETAAGREPIVSVANPIAPWKDILIERHAAERARLLAQAQRELADFDPNGLPGAEAYWDFEAEGLADRLDAARRLTGDGLKLAPGKHGRALQFPGDKEGIALPLDLKEISGEGLTVACWLCEPASKNGTVFTNNGNKALSIGLENLALRIDTQQQHRNGGNVPLDSAVWHHVAVTVANQQVCVYLDGRTVRTLDGKPLQFASTSRLGPNYGGLLDELRIFRRALTADEVRKIYSYDEFLRTAKP